MLADERSQENWIRYDFCLELANKRRKMIYADDKEAWMHGRIEFLEKVIKENLGDEFWNENCKELD